MAITARLKGFHSIYSLWLMAFFAVTAVAVMIAPPPVHTTPPSARAAPSSQTRGQIFEENLGQTDTRARFLTRGRNYTQFVTDDAVVWRFAGAREGHAVYMSFPGAARAQVHGANPLPSRSRCFAMCNGNLGRFGIT